MKKRYLEVGKVVGTHGIKGDIKVQPWCDSPDFLCEFNNLYLDCGEKQVRVLKSRANKNMVIMHIEGIDNIERANFLRNSILYIDRQEAKIDEDTYFIQDIIGMEVVDNSNNNVYGLVTDVIKTGANDVYQVTDSKNKEYMLPVIDDVVKKIDLDGNKVFISPIKGIFENED